MPVKNRTAPPRDLKNVEAQRGVTRLEMATVFTLVGLLAAPLIALVPSSLQATRTGMTEIALERARDALIEYAAANNGCLPFAADFEGGWRDTDLDDGTANPGFVDTGVGIKDRHSGDLPWADLGLVKSFLDGNQLRVQYYVASQYVDDGNTSDYEITCRAGFRGTEWNPSVTYNGSVLKPYFVSYTPAGSDRRIYQIHGILPAGTPPNLASGDIAVDRTEYPLPSPLLEVRRGPNVTGSGGQSDVVSAQNVFVLIAPGTNQNTYLGRGFIRDINHVQDSIGNDWVVNISNVVDGVVFSATHYIDGTDSSNDGDDTLLVMSFINYKAELSKYGLNMDPVVCDTNC